MREIKFRIWDAASILMVYPNENAQFWLHPNGSVKQFDTWCTNDVVLQQFTGLHDKKGREIYEGDIFIIGKKKLFVAYEESNVMFALKEKHEYYDLTEGGMCEYSFSNLEIVGNVYQHPHLL